MTLASTIIQRAYRQENLIAAGTTPTTDEQTEGLELLNDMINQLIGFELGELVFDWLVPTSETAPRKEENPDDPYGERERPAIYQQPPNNVRLATKLTQAQTIYLPQYPNDGSRISFTDLGSSSFTLTLDANGRQIEGAATVAFDPSVTTDREWFYRADTGNWQLRTQLALSDDSPFPMLYDPMLYIGLSIWLAPRTGIEPSAVNQRLYSDMVTKFRSQYKQEIPTPATFNIENIQSLRVDNDALSGFFNG